MPTGDEHRTDEDGLVLKSAPSDVERTEVEDGSFLCRLPCPVFEKVWPLEKVLMGRRVCKWVRAAVKNLEIPWNTLPAVVSRQPTSIIAVTGQIGHGKSTVVRALSGRRRFTWGAEFREALVDYSGDYTIVKVYGRITPEGDKHNFRCFGSESVLDDQKRVVRPGPGEGDPEVLAGPGASDDRVNGGEWELLRHVCLLDPVGYSAWKQLEAALLADEVDAAMLVVAANESPLQPRASAQLAAAGVRGIPHSLVLHSKVELVSPEEARAGFESLRRATDGDSSTASTPVVPISAQLDVNLDVVAHYISRIPQPLAPPDFRSPPLLHVLNSRDPNRMYGTLESMQGGVLIGVLSRGVLCPGAEVEIRPGVTCKEPGGTFCFPLRTRVQWLKCWPGRRALRRAVPGAVVHVGTSMDPALARNGRIVGQVVGQPGRMPPILQRLKVQCRGVPREMLGSERAGAGPPFAVGELVMVQVGKRSAVAGAEVVSVGAGAAGGRGRGEEEWESTVELRLKAPVCVWPGARALLSKRSEPRRSWICVGHGAIVEGSQLQRAPPGREQCGKRWCDAEYSFAPD